MKKILQIWNQISFNNFVHNPIHPFLLSIHTRFKTRHRNSEKSYSVPITPVLTQKSEQKLVERASNSIGKAEEESVVANEVCRDAIPRRESVIRATAFVLTISEGQSNPREMKFNFRINGEFRVIVQKTTYSRPRIDGASTVFQTHRRPRGSRTNKS